MRNWQTKGWTHGDSGLLTIDDRSMDWLRGVQVAERIFIEADGRRKSIHYRIRLFPPHEIVEWLRRAGLVSRALFGDFSGAPFKLVSPRLIVVAEKTAAGAAPERP